MGDMAMRHGEWEGVKESNARPVLCQYSSHVGCDAVQVASVDLMIAFHVTPLLTKVSLCDQQQGLPTAVAALSRAEPPALAATFAGCHAVPALLPGLYVSCTP